MKMIIFLIIVNLMIIIKIMKENQIIKEIIMKEKLEEMIMKI